VLMMASRIPVKGFKELNKELKNLPLKLRKKSLKRAVSAGARIVKKEAKRRAPKRTGVLRRSISIRSSRDKSNKDSVRYSVFVKAGKKRSKGQIAKNQDAFYWYFQEFGYRAAGRKKTKQSKRQRNKSLKGARKIPAVRFLRKSLPAKSTKVISVVRETLKKEIRQYDVRRN